ncbi:uncharacterized protein LOC123523028 [Mercenaria mercenaria]|uniref:uncharacterized protein LOC123523028 n=1 Tax=Mercenaria mercenaria TaxID=6596 RepID=UPI00234EFA9F|nr:uncharacterized protein LOC123523028 [Mercenaria mercenaria]
MDTDSDSETPSKRKKMTSSENCVICDTNGPCSDMLKPKDENSWKILLTAAEIRNHDKILQYRNSRSIPNIYYHIECRKLFTHKKELKRIQDHASTSSNTYTNDRVSYKLRSGENSVHSGTLSVNETCIFCDKTSKYIKGTNTREILCKSVDLRSDITVRNAAVTKMDSKILRITSQELVATEARYHRSCYKAYTCSTKSAKSGQTGTEVEETDVYSVKETDSYSLLFDYIRNDVFKNPRVVAMKSLTDTLVSSMISFGIKEVKPQTKKHVRRMIEGEFGSSIEIVKGSNGRLYILPSNMSRSMLVQENVRIMSELENLKTEYPRVNLKQTALKIRSDIKSHDTEQEWPPNPENLTLENLSIPESLTGFFEVMISGNIDTDQTSKRVKSLAKSFAQDCVFTTSGGRQKPPKHILLPWTVKALTGNVELIKILNRLGHGISYSVLEELDTALCLQKLAETDESNIALPANILPCIPTTVAFDNIDRLEETLSGEGTSHRVNGIIVQPQVPTVTMGKTTRTVLNTTKRRSISHVLSTPVEPYIASTKRVGPQPTSYQMDDNNNIELVDAVEAAHTKNLIWCMLRQKDPINQKVSSWTGFNIQVRDTVDIKQDKVGYLPTINAPATDMSTVNEILQQCLKIIAMLDVKEIVCVFDQALYAKAAEIIWKNVETFKSVIIRLGVFHTICNFMGIIGKRFKDAGLRDLAVESLVVAEGSIDGVLEGRKYNRAVRTHKLVYEAMMRLVWKGFLSWIEANHPEEMLHMDDTFLNIDRLHANTCHEQLHEFVSSLPFKHIHELFIMYKNVLRKDCGQLAAFWMSYLDIVEVVLGLIRASREGDWQLHLAMIREIIPWCFAYDRQNYARYLSVYYTDMTRLHISHPDTYDHFLHGGFSVQRGEWNTFGRIPVDQTIEETVNRDTQTAGGTKGFSLNPGAISRYYLTAEYRSICLRNIREMTDIKVTGLSHVDLEPERVKKDESAVQAILDLLENKWLNPFVGNSELVSLSTGMTASMDICNDLLGAKEKGENAYQAFKENRLLTEQPSEMFYDRLPRQQLKTFSSIQKTKKTKISGNEYILKADNKLFGHMVLVASSRHLDMKEVLRHPLGPLPWALANCDGTLKKTNKSSLARKLDKRADSGDTVPQSSACVVDAMMIVNKISGENRTFEDLSENIFDTVLRCGKNCSRIDVVFDTYRNISIKNAERRNRGSDNGLRFCHISRGQRVQQ